MAEDRASKTEEPTGRRIQQAHSKGQFAKSEELTMTAMLFALMVMVIFYIPTLASKYMSFGAHMLANIDTDILTPASTMDAISNGIMALLFLIMPFLFASALASIAAGGFMSGFKPTLKVMEPNFNKFNVISGMKKIFSTKNLVQGGTDFLKVVAIVLVMWGALYDLKDNVIFHQTLPVQNIPRFIYDTAIIMFFRMMIVMAFIATVHYAYQKWDTLQDMKMTKQEVKDERKMSEGDPQVKQRQRQVAMRLARAEMLGNVSTADVVVTNPTHYAVALKYERGKDLAPVVVAKGENLLARRIKGIAKEFEVPTVENKLLARTLFRIGKVGQPIPAELYQVVADTLAYVYKTYRYYFYKLKGRRASAP